MLTPATNRHLLVRKFAVTALAAAMSQLAYPHVADASPGGDGAPLVGSSADPPSHHDIHIHLHEVRHTNTFVITGRVPTLPHGTFRLKRNEADAGWLRYKRIATDRVGTIQRTYVAGPSFTCFEIVVPATANCRKTRQFIGCVI